MKEQTEFWKSNFGDEYTKRNNINLDKLYIEKYGISRTALNKFYLDGLSKNIKILEIGCNRGQQLKLLKNQGFNNLYGIDINRKALNIAKKSFKVCKGNILDLPFKNNSFDLVLISGVLIHIEPFDLHQAITEINRVAKKYIYVLEYYADEYKSIEYRGYKNKLWKNNFLSCFLKYSQLKVIKESKLKYLDSDNIDHIFLLEKRVN